MEVQVRGKNGFEVTDAINAYAEQKLEKIERYFKEELSRNQRLVHYRKFRSFEICWIKTISKNQTFQC